MALLQIVEPGAVKKNSQEAAGIVVGIDLGTTNSLVAVAQSGSVNVLKDNKGDILLPSVVYYLTSGEVIVGDNQAAAKDVVPIRSVKRLLGRKQEDLQDIPEYCYPLLDDLNGMVQLQTAVGMKSPVAISADILRAIKARVAIHYKQPIVGAVITVPAYFDDAQRQATKDAAKLADLKVLRLINEPTAAALAYGLEAQAEGIYVVYDLGGGTFDCSVLQLQQNVFQVLATAGDTALGGDDVDYIIIQWLREQSFAGLNPEELQSASEIQRSQQWQSYLMLARLIKHALTHQQQIILQCQFNHAGKKHLQISITDESHRIINKLEFMDIQNTFDLSNQVLQPLILTQRQLNQRVDSLIDRSLKVCEQALQDAGVTKREVKQLVLVGGMTRMPWLQRRVGDWFDQQPLHNIDPEQVVAMGAALQAEALSTCTSKRVNSDWLLLDVIPLSLGVEVMGGLVDNLIPRNTAIPFRKSREFTTFADGQIAMSIHVLQGERDLAEDCRSLAKFELRGIPPLAAGLARIRVTFSLDADGILSVEAKELSQGVIASVTVKPSYGLTEAQVADMIKDAYQHAEQDVLNRNLKEARSEAERLLRDLGRALQQDAEHLLTPQEREILQQKMQQLSELLVTDQSQLIQQRVTDLNKASESFAFRRMNAGIQSALEGQSVSDIANTTNHEN